ncbi:MAG: pseudouridine synthase [Chloroflexota bacterium]
MHILQLAIALDQLANTLACGWADETLSARAWRCRDTRQSWAVTRRIIDALFFWQDGHCRRAYEAEITRQQLPPQYRSN